VSVCVHEKVNSISQYRLSDLVIALPVNVPPPVGHLPKPIRVSIGSGHVRVTKDLKVLSIMMLQQGLEKKSGRVKTKMGRHVSYFQAPCRISRVAMKKSGL
jgi:hypothetical protein